MIAVRTAPKPFSPDGDGVDEALTISLAVRNVYLGVGMAALAVGICWYILSRPTNRLEQAAA